MNKIMKKLDIPGYETKDIIKKTKKNKTKQVDSIQLSLDMDMAPKGSAKAK